MEAEGRFSPTLYTLEGRMVRTQAPTSGSIELDVRALPAGVYLLRVATEKGVVTRRVVKN
ncbi:MAG TPA: hypothetical protein DCE41_05825 [Cytophagales bacterium]|nr:hypothetical protein [Cytophagales bacterium]